MKKIIYALLFSGMIAIFPKASQACVNPDSVVTIIVNYDTVTNAPFITNIEIRLTNLRLMSENPNKFCSCALSKWNDLFKNIDYVAFVDSGTNDPYLGFAVWNQTLKSSVSWDNSQPGFNWSGYISDVINGGLSASDPVDLVIRASTPPPLKYTLNGDSSLSAKSLYNEVQEGYLGTDEWNPVTESLVSSHQGVRSFHEEAIPGNSISFNIEDPSYFTQLDDDILNNIPTGIFKNYSSTQSFSIYPNPANSNLNIEFHLDQSDMVEISLFDILGKQVKSLVAAEYHTGNQKMQVPLTNVKEGVYFLKIDIGENHYTEKLLIN